MSAFAERLRALKPPPAVWGLLAVYGLFALFVPRFASCANLQNVLRVASLVCIVGCGQAIVIIAGGIEFSFGSSVGLASIVTVLALPTLGVVGGFLCGAAAVLFVGAFNGMLVAVFRVPPFIVTLGMLMAVYGISATLAGGLPIEAPPGAAFTWLARGRLAGLPVPVLAAAMALLVLAGLLHRTAAGRAWALVGANPLAAALAGIDARRAQWTAYLAGAAFCALGAAFYTSRVASGQPSLAPNLPFDTIAACAVGGIPLAGGQGRASQVLCGVLVLAAVNNAVVLLNLSAAYQQLVTAAVLLGAVLLQHLTLGFDLRRLSRGLGGQQARRS